MSGRNDPCPCGSGKKYKHCCLRQKEAATTIPNHPHVGAVEIVLNWLESRHRKGWFNAIEHQRDELMTPEDWETFMSLNEDAQTNIQVNMAEVLLAEGNIEVQDYRVVDWSALSHALAGQDDVEGDREDGWSRIMRCTDGQIRPLAHINLGTSPHRLEIFYKTQRYAQQGRTWFDALVGKSVTFLERKVVSHNTQEKSRQPATGRKSHPDNMDPREVTQAIQETILRLYANWADEPLPVLNHQTPRQAIQSKGGLERVKGLLRSYETSDQEEATRQGREASSYDFLWESLNIAR